MNTKKGKAKFKNFRVLLESGRCSTILMGILVKIGLEEDSPMQWNIQAVNITTNLQIKVYFTLPALSASNVVTWNCHMYDSAKSRYQCWSCRGFGEAASVSVIKELINLRLKCQVLTLSRGFSHEAPRCYLKIEWGIPYSDCK